MKILLQTCIALFIFGGVVQGQPTQSPLKPNSISVKGDAPIIDNITAENEWLKQRILDLEEKLVKQSHETKRLRKKSQNALSKISQMDTEIKSKAKLTTELNSKINELMFQNQLNEQSILSIQSEKKVFETLYTNSEEMNDVLKNRLKTYQKDYNDLTNRNRIISDQLDESVKEIERLEQIIVLQQNTIDSQGVVIVLKQDTIDAQKEIIENLRTVVGKECSNVSIIRGKMEIKLGSFPKRRIKKLLVNACYSEVASTDNTKIAYFYLIKRNPNGSKETVYSKEFPMQKGEDGIYRGSSTIILEKRLEDNAKYQCLLMYREGVILKAEFDQL